MMEQLIKYGVWEGNKIPSISENIPEYLISKGGVIEKPIRKKPKRVRTAFTTEQILALEKVFQHQEYVDRTKRLELVSTLGLSDRNIKVWFQNRRMKKKRDISSDNHSSSSELTPPPSPPNLIKSLLREKHPVYSIQQEEQSPQVNQIYYETQPADQNQYIPPQYVNPEYYQQPQINNYEQQWNFNPYYPENNQYYGWNGAIVPDVADMNAQQVNHSEGYEAVGDINNEVFYVQDDIVKDEQDSFEDSGVNVSNSSDQQGLTAWVSDISSYYENFL